MVIGIDLDDVLAEFHLAFIEFCNATYGTARTKKDFNRPEISQTWEISHAEMLLRANTFAAQSMMKVSPRQGAQKMVSRLVKKHSLHIITNRPVEIRATTELWVNRHFPMIFSGIHFCTKDGGNTILRSKGATCKGIGVAIMLEDFIKNAESCAQAGVHVYLFDQPWNQQEVPLLAGAIIRVSDWQDKILETLT